MFLHVSVILSGGGLLSQHALQVVSHHALQQVSRGGGLQAHTQGGSWGGSAPGPQPRRKLRGIWLGGCLLRGGVERPPQETATAVDGTHPTGMHSCLIAILSTFQFKIVTCFPFFTSEIVDNFPKSWSSQEDPDRTVQNRRREKNRKRGKFTYNKNAFQ